MANTYSQLYFHIVFAVKQRDHLINEVWKDDFYKYIAGIISNRNQKLMIINGMPDHVHILLGTKPDCNLSDLVRDIKSSSSKWVNENQKSNFKFSWQTGFGAFTIGQSQIVNTVNYIKNQQQHHHKKTFKEEYKDFLDAYQVEYQDKYLFE